MRAARYYGKEDIRVEEVEEPAVKDGWIKIKPAFVGICGTDLHEYLGGPNFAPVNPHPVTKETLPVTFGHEFSGTITSLGSGVTEFKVGQKVSIQATIYDTTCFACHDGLENVCYNGGFVGLSGWGGGLSDAVCVPANYVLPLPENIPLDIAALVEPLAVGWHAVSRSPLKNDSTVLILGGGPIGIAVIKALRARGCGKIIVSEISGSRQKFSLHFGADVILDPRKDDVVARAKEETGGEGVDIVFDCAGVASGLKSACQSIKPRGTVVNVAIWEREVPFQPNDLVFKEGNYVTSMGYVQQDFKDVIQAIGSGVMKPGDMITSKIALEDVVKSGFMELIHNKENHVKILVQI
ncbi:(R,R)-butanediol dehydrogenase [Lachnellula hyalina]|uniref:(R,R)-butanediol dehydrogenase n=1 Tax=Lachnellula hyalina TaxID=1316788 RepID=A0A8H8QX90_9HELO|nr:(R,R)-butanediol dehydrogenase [Lachnellula hyalina]TVY23415.1 (R,R)-butanediol dehydrogenase [Lachnellula hyalina]